MEQRRVVHREEHSLYVEFKVLSSSSVSVISHLCSFLRLSLPTYKDKEVKTMSFNQHPNSSPIPVCSTPLMYLEFTHCFSSPLCLSFSHQPLLSPGQLTSVASYSVWLLANFNSCHNMVQYLPISQSDPLRTKIRSFHPPD